MKTRSLFLFLLTLSILFGCKKSESVTVPVLTTIQPTMFTDHTAQSGGIISSDGGGALTEMGVCWALTANPTITDSIKASVTSSSSFTCDMFGLDFATTYHVRAFATNSAGTGYGDDVTFKTAGAIPIVSTDSTNEVSKDAATLWGTVNPNFLATTVTFEYGTSTNYSDTVSYSKNPVSNNIAVDVSVDLTDLTPGTTYHFKVTAVNPMGTVDGDDLTFTTEAN